MTRSMMEKPMTREFWVQRFKANTLLEAIAEYPKEARRFFGDVAFEPMRTEELAMVAYAHYCLLLSDKELLQEIHLSRLTGQGGEPALQTKSSWSIKTRTFHTSPQGEDDVQSSSEPVYSRALSDPLLKGSLDEPTVPESPSHLVQNQREFARAVLRAAGVTTAESDRGETG
jgi:hypothetical protein